MKDLQITPQKAARVRNQLGLSQREVADDIKKMTSGAISIDNTKLSRFERGLINLSDKALKKLIEYYDRKAIEKGQLEEVDDEEDQLDVNVQPDNSVENEEDTEVEQEKAESEKPTKVVKLAPRKKSVVDDSFGKDAIEFDNRIDEDVRGALLAAYDAVNDKIDESLEYRAAKGFFGYSDEDDEKALQLIFDMAAAYNVVRTLQGRPVFPAFKSDEPEFEAGSLLAVLKSSYPDYVHWLFIEGEDAEEPQEEQKSGLL